MGSVWQACQSPVLCAKSSNPGLRPSLSAVSLAKQSTAILRWTHKRLFTMHKIQSLLCLLIPGSRCKQFFPFVCISWLVVQGWEQFIFPSQVGILNLPPLPLNATLCKFWGDSVALFTTKLQPLVYASRRNTEFSRSGFSPWLQLHTTELHRDKGRGEVFTGFQCETAKRCKGEK